MLPIAGDNATSSFALIPAQAEMQAKSLEHRVTVARQVNVAIGTPIAMEVIVEERHIPLAEQDDLRLLELQPLKVFRR